MVCLKTRILNVFVFWIGLSLSTQSVDFLLMWNRVITSCQNVLSCKNKNHEYIDRMLSSSYTSWIFCIALLMLLLQFSSSFVRLHYYQALQNFIIYLNQDLPICINASSHFPFLLPSLGDSLVYSFYTWVS